MREGDDGEGRRGGEPLLGSTLPPPWVHGMFYVISNCLSKTFIRTTCQTFQHSVARITPTFHYNILPSYCKGRHFEFVLNQIF